MNPIGFINAGTSARRYYTTDGMGSVTEVFNQTGASIATYQYDPFGEDTGGTGSSTNPTKYKASWQDKELYHTPYRAGSTRYDPLNGRSLTARAASGGPPGVATSGYADTAAITPGNGLGTQHSCFIYPSIARSPANPMDILMLSRWECTFDPIAATFVFGLLESPSPFPHPNELELGAIRVRLLPTGVDRYIPPGRALLVGTVHAQRGVCYRATYWVVFVRYVAVEFFPRPVFRVRYYSGAGNASVIGGNLGALCF